MQPKEQNQFTGLIAVTQAMFVSGLRYRSGETWHPLLMSIEGEIYILGAIPKYEAIQAGLSVADTMAELLRALLPIYRAAVTTT
jgi:hypothetical protein